MPQPLPSKIKSVHSETHCSFLSLSLPPADPLDPHSELEGEAPDGSFANRNGRHAIGHVDDFSALQQQVLEGRSLVQRMETTLQTSLSQPLLNGNQEQTSDLVRGQKDNFCVATEIFPHKTMMT